MNHPLGVALALATAIPTTFIYDGMPPPRFQGDATATVTFVKDLNNRFACGTPPEGMTFLGCRRGTTIYMPNPCPRGDVESFAKVMCHELAHRNGWPAEHGP